MPSFRLLVTLFPRTQPFPPSPTHHQFRISTPSSVPKNASPSRMSDLSLLSTSSLYERLGDITVPASSPHVTFTNWAGTFTCHPLVVFEPRNVRQCAMIFELARREGKTVRAVGVGHSPSDLACTNEYMLRTTKLDKIIEVSSLLVRAPQFPPILALHSLPFPLSTFTFLFFPSSRPSSSRPSPSDDAMMNQGSLFSNICQARATNRPFSSHYSFLVFSSHK